MSPLPHNTNIVKMTMVISIIIMMLGMIATSVGTIFVTNLNAIVTKSVATSTVVAVVVDVDVNVDVSASTADANTLVGSNI